MGNDREQAIEAWMARVDDAMLSFDHSWGLPDTASCQPFGQHEKHAAVRKVLREAVALMRSAPPAPAEWETTMRELLQVVAMLPEDDLPIYIIDPYGVIGDALDLLGESRQPDIYRALHRCVGFPDPGEKKPTPPAPPAPDAVAELRALVAEMDKKENRMFGLSYEEKVWRTKIRERIAALTKPRDRAEVQEGS